MSSATDEHDLVRLEHAWMDAWRLKDASAAEAILADDFTLISATTEVPVPRAMWLAGAMGHITCRSFR